MQNAQDTAWHIALNKALKFLTIIVVFKETGNQVFYVNTDNEKAKKEDENRHYLKKKKQKQSKPIHTSDQFKPET